MEHQKVREFKNKKASYQYQLTDVFTAGIQLVGTEIKSIRNGKVNFNNAYCFVDKNSEVYIKGLHIAEYQYGNIENHEPQRTRKLLLQKKEIKKIRKYVTERGYTLIPISLFINERGLVKVEIALAQGKKLHDKRKDIKDKDMKRDMDRMKF
ncbi:MAG: SsrA-binding protein SmpB [Candidatus Delongbacteria bacterium]|jgi:SsrA-binding protein|nr:SsrA-binding protein SmpB [Candidatus Delongbacteria bacterium]